MFCNITYPDGRPFEGDTRYVLQQAVAAATQQGYSFFIGSEIEFYLFQMDENGNPTRIPYDNAGYMDIAPEDKGENVRREICLTLEQMDIYPESSHHEGGPGQNEIDFRYADPLRAADNAVTFRTVVKTIAAQNGLWADFSPRPLADHNGSGLHINVSAQNEARDELLPGVIAGLLEHVREMTVFLNPSEGSYARLGRDKAPKAISWSEENRAQLIRVPAASGEYRRAELRSPDPEANPYLAFALVIYAALDGINRQLPLPEPTADNKADCPQLPGNLQEAREIASRSLFLKEHLPERIMGVYTAC
jgi:glutamine synthetase